MIKRFIYDQQTKIVKNHKIYLNLELIPTQKYLLNIILKCSTKWLLCSVKVYERDETVATICSSDSPNITLGNLLFVYSWAYSGIFVAKQTNRTH